MIIVQALLNHADYWSLRLLRILCSHLSQKLGCTSLHFRSQHHLAVDDGVRRVSEAIVRDGEQGKGEQPGKVAFQ